MRQGNIERIDERGSVSEAASANVSRVFENSMMSPVSDALRVGSHNSSLLSQTVKEQQAAKDVRDIQK